MSLVVYAAPSPVVTLDEVKRHLPQIRDSADDDVYVAELIAAVTAKIDGPDGWLGRALGRQTIDFRLDSFAETIRLPLPPIVSITSVKYLDVNEAETTLATTEYTLRTDGFLVRAVGKSWPSLGIGAEPVRIRYLAGYTTIPPQAGLAIKLLVGHYHLNREASAAVAMLPLPFGVEELLAPLRIHG